MVFEMTTRAISLSHRSVLHRTNDPTTVAGSMVATRLWPRPSIGVRVHEWVYLLFAFA